MANYRETPCKHYIAYHQCSKGRPAEHKGICRHCAKYEPRARIRHINRKKEYLNNLKRKEII